MLESTVSAIHNKVASSDHFSISLKGSFGALLKIKIKSNVKAPLTHLLAHWKGKYRLHMVGEGPFSFSSTTPAAAAAFKAFLKPLISTSI